MFHFTSANPHHAVVRAEMRALRLRAHMPVGHLLLGLLGAASAASAILSLTAY
jgi:hypothetical protein